MCDGISYNEYSKCIIFGYFSFLQEGGPGFYCKTLLAP